MMLRRLRLDSTRHQVIAIVTISAVVAHVLVVGSFMYFNPLGSAVSERVAAREIGLMVRLYRALPPGERVMELKAAAGPGMLVEEQIGGPPGLAADPEGAERAQRAVQAAVGDPSEKIVAGFNPDADPGGEMLRRFAVQVAERTWLVFDVQPRERQRPPTLRMIFSVIILIGVPLVLISLWAAYRVTNPLRRLAEFTEQFGSSGTPLPIPTEGTLEIRKVARAFNGILERLHRMVADRTNMLAAISHDLRTPLTRLRLRTEALEEGALRGKMLRDIQAMDFMIASTLGYIEQQHSREPPVALDLAALMQTLCDDFADGGYDVTYEGPLHCAATCRPVAIERALNNLIENAVKFGAAVTLTLSLTDGALMVEVRDDGPGIAEHERENVLKPFYRTDAARSGEAGGVGLGLAIVNTIVQADGGTLQLLDREPQGLCVRLRLPRSVAN